jgi:hypothetical protein
MAEVGTSIFLGDKLIETIFLGDGNTLISPFILPETGIVTNGLILYFNTTLTACYPGSGTNVFNLVAGQDITGSLVNGVTYKDNYLQFNGTTQYMNVPTTLLDYRSGTSTVMGASRYADTSDNGRVISTGDVAASNWLLGHFSNTTLNYYPNGEVQLNNGPNDTNWRIYAGTGDTATDKWSLYVNGEVNTLDSSAGAAGPYGFQIGRNSNSSEYSSGSLAILMLYNRVLSGAEVAQTYDVLKSTVGL